MTWYLNATGTIVDETSFSFVDMEATTRETGLAHTRCGRRARRKRKCNAKLRPIICSQDREIVGLRQWMKKNAVFKCSLIPTIFHGKFDMSMIFEHLHEKANNLGSDQVQLNPGCTSTEDG